MKKHFIVLVLFIIGIILFNVLAKESTLLYGFKDNVQEDKIEYVLKTFDDNGLDPVYNDQLRLDVLRGNSRYYKLTNGEWFNLYIYEDAGLMYDDFHSISEDGYGILDVEYEWVSPPHFYLCGNLLIQYIGTNSEVLEILDELGDEITGR